MADSKQWAPYAPPSTVLHAIQHYRRRDIPPKIDVTDLIQIGVSDGLTTRTHATLIFLGLLDEKGNTTETFRSLRYANDDQFQQVFAGVIQNAYQDIFDHVDPAT